EQGEPKYQNSRNDTDNSHALFSPSAPSAPVYQAAVAAVSCRPSSASAASTSSAKPIGARRVSDRYRLTSETSRNEISPMVSTQRIGYIAHCTRPKRISPALVDWIEFKILAYDNHAV